MKTGLMTAPVLCIGAAHWDMIARTRSHLALGADVPGRIARQPGGVALNIALALVELGMPATLLAAIGSDAAGDDLMREITALGVDTRPVLRPAGPSDLYVAIETPSGDIFAAVADCRAVETHGHDLLTAVPIGAHQDILIDGNLPPPVFTELADHPAIRGARLSIVAASPDKTAWLAPLISREGALLYLNRAEAEALAGESFADSLSAATALRARGAYEVLVTDGPRAATHATRHASVSALPPAVRTRGLTGAGDRLVAAHLAARVRGLAPEAALREALAAAARHIMREMP